MSTVLNFFLNAAIAILTPVACFGALASIPLLIVSGTALVGFIALGIATSKVPFFTVE